MKNAGQIANEVAKKFKKGDSIGDTELAVAALYWRDVADKLSWLGPEFGMAWTEANRIAIALVQFCDARGM